MDDFSTPLRGTNLCAQAGPVYLLLSIALQPNRRVWDRRSKSIVSSHGWCFANLFTRARALSPSENPLWGNLNSAELFWVVRTTRFCTRNCRFESEVCCGHLKLGSYFLLVLKYSEFFWYYYAGTMDSGFYWCCSLNSKFNKSKSAPRCS